MMINTCMLMMGYFHCYDAADVGGRGVYDVSNSEQYAWASQLLKPELLHDREKKHHKQQVNPHHKP